MKPQKMWMTLLFSYWQTQKMNTPMLKIIQLKTVLSISPCQKSIQISIIHKSWINKVEYIHLMTINLLMWCITVKVVLMNYFQWLNMKSLRRLHPQLNNMCWTTKKNFLSKVTKVTKGIKVTVVNVVNRVTKVIEGKKVKKVTEVNKVHKVNEVKEDLEGTEDQKVHKVRLVHKVQKVLTVLLNFLNSHKNKLKWLEVHKVNKENKVLKVLKVLKVQKV